MPLSPLETVSFIGFCDAEDSRLLDCCLKVFVGTCHTTPILEVQQICSDLQLCLTGSPPFEVRKVFVTSECLFSWTDPTCRVVCW